MFSLGDNIYVSNAVYDIVYITAAINSRQTGERKVLYFLLIGVNVCL